MGILNSLSVSNAFAKRDYFSPGWSGGRGVQGLVAKVEKTIRVRLYRNFPETLIRKVEGGKARPSSLFHSSVQ